MVVSRVTQQLMTNTFISDIQRNLKSLNELQRQISTGKRIRFPSDDPVDADRILDYRQTVAQVKQFSKNVDDLDSLGANADGVMGTVTDLLMRVRDLALRGANEATLTQSDRDALADEIDQIIHELVFQANQKFDGKHLFAGNKTETPPFEITNELEFVVDGASNVISMPAYAYGGATKTKEAINNGSVIMTGVYVNGAVDAGATINPDTNQIILSAAPPAGSEIRVVFNKDVLVKYSGDSGTREVEISEGAKLSVMYPGASFNTNDKTVFGSVSGDPTGVAGVEAFQTLIDIRDNLYKYDDVTAGTETQLRDGVDDIDSFLSGIYDVRSDLGGRMNRLELAKNRLENIGINTKDLLSKKEDIDMAEAISEMVLQQNVYQAALGVGARILQISLLDFLR